MDILSHLEKFTTRIPNEIEIYNEASIQFELAIHLRNILDKKYKIQLERNIGFFSLPKTEFQKTKTEMDIAVFTLDRKEKHCIELKFPTQGQHPEQMFSACKDIAFLEKLVKHGFDECYFMMFTKDPLFYSERAHDSDKQIYRMFRKEKLLKGEIRKPTGNKDETLRIDHEYKIDWKALENDLRCFILEIRD